MEKITGIRSVDFKIIAKGHGVVNWNGPTNLAGEDGKTVDNHTMPKLRGYTNLSGKVKENGYKYRKEPQDIDFSKTPLYISQNCIRHHLFKQDGFIDYQDGKIAENMDTVICSLTGLLRGYVIPDKEYKRTSPLLITDFEDQLGNGNFEQMGRAGSKEKQKTKSGNEKSNSLFSKTTFGATHYEAYGSISIEQLQFIPLDNTYGRMAYLADPQKAKELATKLKTFLAALSDSDKNHQPEVIYNKNFVRRGSIYSGGESGLLLNEDAIDVCVNQMLNLLEGLVIRQAKGYMYVDSIELDYNNSEKSEDMFRIFKDDGSSLNDKKPEGEKYAVYFDPLNNKA